MGRIFTIIRAPISNNFREKQYRERCRGIDGEYFSDSENGAYGAGSDRDSLKGVLHDALRGNLRTGQAL